MTMTSTKTATEVAGAAAEELGQIAASLRQAIAEKQDAGAAPSHFALWLRTSISKLERVTTELEEAYPLAMAEEKVARHQASTPADNGIAAIGQWADDERPVLSPLPMDENSIRLREYGAQLAQSHPPLTNEQRAEIIAILRAVQPRPPKWGKP